jgi:predicted aspartyl protease
MRHRTIFPIRSSTTILNGTIALVFAAALALSGCARDRDASSGASGTTAGAGDPVSLDEHLAAGGYRMLPLRRLATGHFAVDGTAGAVVLTLIVDTGASHTILDRERARRFDLVVRADGGRAAGLGTVDQPVGTGTLRDVDLGPLHLDSLAVSVLDLSHVNRVLREMEVAPIDGIIGADMLLRKHAIIDYGGPSLYVRDP